jgi:hypothetical protein
VTGINLITGMAELMMMMMMMMRRRRRRRRRRTATTTMMLLHAYSLFFHNQNFKAKRKQAI